MTTTDRDARPKPLSPPAHSRRGRRLPVGSSATWPRRVLVATNLVVALCLVSTAVVYGYVRYRVGQLKTIRLPALSKASPGARAGSDGLAPMNILLVGSNTRTGLDPAEAAQFGSATQVTGARSDVTMILHLDPATSSASLLSIPRDVFVPLPPHSMSGSVGKIDAALNDGPNNLINAITSDFGIPINHYVEVNFDGFQRTINAIGGIKMSFPTPLRDIESALRITRTGCQQLNGPTALAVVRARQLQYFANGRWQPDPLSDLARIRRDHTFLRIFVKAAKAQVQVTNPLGLNALVGGLLNQVTVDSGLTVSTLLTVFRHYRHLNPDMVPETTLPITVVGNYRFAGGAYGDVDMPVEPLDHQVINAWSPPSLTPASPSETGVQVINISGQYRKETSVASDLMALGYHVTGTTTATTPAAITETVIHYRPGSLPAAFGLLRHLSGAVMLAPDPAAPAGGVALYVGSVVAVTAAAAPPASPGAPSATTATTASGSVGAVTTIPTALGQTPSSAVDQQAAFDPIPC